jgi:hypothetical protein
MNRFLLLLSAGGLLASIVVHLLTFVPGSPVAMGQVWPLHVLLFIPFSAMVVRLKALQLPGMTQREYQRALTRYVPAPVRIAVIGAFAYAMLNFGLFFMQASGGGPMQQDGRYYRANHGRIIAEISEVEYHRLEALQVRGFSGHWLVFYAIPAIFFAWVEPKARADRYPGVSAPAPRHSLRR